MTNDSLPLVSCIMPTANRRQFVPHAIRYFLAQDYPNKELLVVDDGDDIVQDLIPCDPQIRYLRLSGKRTLGAKRNECVTASRGDLIMHWDDDDWMASHRIRYQVQALLTGKGEVCGTRQMLFYEMATGATWLYDYPSNLPPILIGGSLLYTKEFWRRSPFPHCQVGSDTRFIWNQKLDKAVWMPDHMFYVAMIHPHNTSPKVCSGGYWKSWSGDIVDVLDRDYLFYRPSRTVSPSTLQEKQVSKESITAASVTAQLGSAIRGSEKSGEFPLYGILMVTHQALEMVRLSTLRTLRHSAGQRAKLVIVDNASEDGTLQWLKLLAARGDIHLIENSTNIGHGPGLELARQRINIPYLVALDSDAFPLRDTWLSELRDRLVEPVKVAGILHHRDYIHPSCLMIHRDTLNEYAVTFLAEKDKSSGFDVAERISHEIKRHGGKICGLQRTESIQRGSISEPVYLGSGYEGIVYHQWYTSRATTAEGAQVDDVPRGAIDASLKELFERFNSEPRELTVVIGARVRPDEPERLRNLKATLQGLNIQDLPRWRYRIVFIEQDDAPRVQNEVVPFVDRYFFAFNPGPYNRGWGFNIGASLPTSRVGALCLIDADLLVPPDFLSRCLSILQSGARAVLPYQEILYLDKRSTDQAIEYGRLYPLQINPGLGYTGRLFDTSQGGCFWIDSGLYSSIGGHDECFIGWGAEDREFWDRVERATTVQQLTGRLFHLHHRRPAMDDGWARANQERYRKACITRPRTLTVPMGQLDRYLDRQHSASLQTEQPAGPGWREWENWHQWEEQRIQNIIRDEQQCPSSESARRRLASVVVRFGHSLLDAGCGPGATWIHLMQHRHDFEWTGMDVTEKMIAAARAQHPTVPVTRGDVGSLPFIDNSYDIVLFRHVLEHLPSWLMRKAVIEAIRVARRAVVVDFYVPPAEGTQSRTARVGGNFLETQWSVKDLIDPIMTSGWNVFQRFPITGRQDDKDEIWVLTPPEVARELEVPKVSIVMPTYQRSHTIYRTVDSILGQTYSNWELIIVDNNGNASYCFNDSRIHLHHDSAVISSSYARNQGLRYVSGDLVCFFDDDDDMFPTYIEQFVRVFQENPSANMARCGMIVSDGTVNFSYATPECCLRRPFAIPAWTNSGPAQDQEYFSKIVAANGWSKEKGDIAVIQTALCSANADPKGGLRHGKY